MPINSRTALEATTLPTGGGRDGTEPLMIRKGEAVGYSVYVMHRLKKLYGEDADLFRPERWDPNEDNAVDLRQIGWGYLPFNGGPRVCLGRKSLFLCSFAVSMYGKEVRYSCMVIVRGTF